jgi:hypothetical protein
VLSKTLEEREGDLGGRASLSRRDGARAAMVLTNHKFFSGKLAASWGAPVGPERDCSWFLADGDSEGMLQRCQQAPSWPSGPPERTLPILSSGPTRRTAWGVACLRRMRHGEVEVASRGGRAVVQLGASRAGENWQG